MPKSIHSCCYKMCDSNSQIHSGISFFKFPADAERCKIWIINCNNISLNEIFATKPAKFRTLRVCQKHFLKEFVGPSGRLVNHAVPLPYGVPLNQINGDKFMSECANIRTLTTLSQQESKYQPQVLTSPSETLIETNEPGPSSPKEPAILDFNPDLIELKVSEGDFSGYKISIEDERIDDYSVDNSSRQNEANNPFSSLSTPEYEILFD